MEFDSKDRYIHTRAPVESAGLGVGVRRVREKVIGQRGSSSLAVAGKEFSGIGSATIFLDKDSRGGLKGHGIEYSPTKKEASQGAQSPLEMGRKSRAKKIRREERQSGSKGSHAHSAESTTPSIQTGHGGECKPPGRPPTRREGAEDPGEWDPSEYLGLAQAISERQMRESLRDMGQTGEQDWFTRAYQTGQTLMLLQTLDAPGSRISADQVVHAIITDDTVKEILAEHFLQLPLRSIPQGKIRDYLRAQIRPVFEGVVRNGDFQKFMQEYTRILPGVDRTVARHCEEGATREMVFRNEGWYQEAFRDAYGGPETYVQEQYERLSQITTSQVRKVVREVSDEMDLHESRARGDHRSKEAILHELQTARDSEDRLLRSQGQPGLQEHLQQMIEMQTSVVRRATVARIRRMWGEDAIDTLPDTLREWLVR